jgi:hypothetical protein
MKAARMLKPSCGGEPIWQGIASRFGYEVGRDEEADPKGSFEEGQGAKSER